MTIQECYSHMGGQYEEVLRRLGNEERVMRFLNRFLEEDSYASLETALLDDDQEKAFRAAHSLKGVCVNLGLTTLYLSSNALTEALRAKQASTRITMLFQQVALDYQNTMISIKQLLGK